MQILPLQQVQGHLMNYLKYHVTMNGWFGCFVFNGQFQMSPKGFFFI